MSHQNVFVTGMLRFPTGVRLEYRFEFKEPNVRVFSLSLSLTEFHSNFTDIRVLRLWPLCQFDGGHLKGDFQHGKGQFPLPLVERLEIGWHYFNLLILPQTNSGTIFLPCRYSTLIFHPYREGELFEFRILDNPYQYLDKCSKLVAQYY